jgi:hypothetical protein
MPFFLFVLCDFALGFFRGPVPRIRDFQQCRFVLGAHAIRQPPSVLCISSELRNILHRNGLSSSSFDGTTSARGATFRRILGRLIRSVTEQCGRLSVGRLLRCGMAEVGRGRSRMNLIERYRRYAIDCLKLAQSAGNALLLQMAEAWRHLAELAEARVAAQGNKKS